MRRTAGAALALLSILLLAPVTAPAQEASVAERIDAYSVVLQRYEQQLPRDADLTREVGLMRSWLGEAQSFASRGETEQAEAVLERVQAQSELVDALVGRAEALGTDEQATARVAALQRELTQVRQEIARLEQRRTELHQEGI